MTTTYHAGLTFAVNIPKGYVKVFNGSRPAAVYVLSRFGTDPLTPRGRLKRSAIRHFLNPKTENSS